MLAINTPNKTAPIVTQIELTEQQRLFCDKLKQSIVEWFEATDSDEAKVALFLPNTKISQPISLVIFYRLLVVGIGNPKGLPAHELLVISGFSHKYKIFASCKNIHRVLIRTDSDYQKNFAAVALKVFKYLPRHRDAYISEKNLQNMFLGVPINYNLLITF